MTSCLNVRGPVTVGRPKRFPSSEPLFRGDGAIRHTFFWEFMTLTMIDGMDAAERLGFRLTRMTLNYVTLGLPSLLASTMWLNATRRILAVGGPGRWSLYSSAGYSQP